VYEELVKLVGNSYEPKLKRQKVLLMGLYGSGKTTTIRMLCGLLTPDKGRGTCLGYDILTETDKIKLQVGYMTQRFSLYQDLSVRENLEFVARLYDIADPVGAARRMVDRLGLKGREEQHEQRDIFLPGQPRKFNRKPRRQREMLGGAAICHSWNPLAKR